MRKFKFKEGSYYHVCNRSNDKGTIFMDSRDYARFLFYILFYQAAVPFHNLGRYISHYVKHSMFNIPETTIDEMGRKKIVGLSGFVIMPNHFHLLLQEGGNNGASQYLQRAQNGYAKYFNAKYAKRGHLFQGAFRAIPVDNDEQLKYLSAYIHRNPHELGKWKNKEISYPWSSYQDCVGKNRWGELLKPNIFLDQFSSPAQYRDFVETSTAKLRQGEVPLEANMLLE